MAPVKKIQAVVKMQLPAGKATPAPPVGSRLGPFGINLGMFTKEFNDKTASQAGLIIPVVITIYQDRSFSFELKTPPVAVLIKKALKIEAASGINLISRHIRNLEGNIIRCVRHCYSVSAAYHFALLRVGIVFGA